MSEGGHRPKPGAPSNVGRPQSAEEPRQVLPAGADRDRSVPLTDPMRHVRYEQQQAAAQIQRSLKAWRKVGDQKAAASPGEDNSAAAPAETAPPVAAKLQSGTIARKKKDEPTGPDKSPKASGTGASGDRVKQPVPGLYDSINGGLSEKKSMAVGNLVFKDKVERKYPNGGPRQITTFVDMPGNDKVFGQVTRSLEVGADGSKTLVMDMAFLDTIPKEQSWVTEDGKALQPGRGIPLQTYLSIRQMKMFGVEYGDLGKPNFQKVKLSTIVNQRTIWELAEFTKKEPGASEFDRLKRTHSVQYAETVITQAGAKIVDAHLENAAVTTAQQYAKDKNAPDEPKKRGLAPNDPVKKNFDINLKVAPFSSKSSVPTDIKVGDS